MWKFVVFKEEYGEEEKLYLIRKNLQCSIVQWDAIPDEEKEECFEQQLWIKDNFKVSQFFIYIYSNILLYSLFSLLNFFILVVFDIIQMLCCI